MGTGLWRGRGWAWRVAMTLLVLLVAAPVLLLLLFRFVPVPGTPEMLVSLIEGKGAHYAWTDQLPPILGKSVIGSEDQNFCSHHGFDWKSIDQAMAAHERDPKKRLRGASTISQQTARTLFLVPVRSWIRKGAEAYLTVLMEALWPKKRILEAYLNVAEWGDGIYGAEAASRAYFGIPASRLDFHQAALLATALPSPVARHPNRPGRAHTALASALLARMARSHSDTTCLR